MIASAPLPGFATSSDNAALQDRIAAAHQIANRHSASATAELWSRYQGETNPFVRAALVDSLAAVCRNSCLPQFQAALDDSAPEVRLEVVQALGNTPGKTTPPLLQRLLAQDPNEGVRLSAAFWLAHSNDAATENALVQALAQDRDPHVRAQAALSLKQSANASTRRKIQQARNDGDARVRKIANEP